MNARTYPTQVSSRDDIITGYRAITGGTVSTGQDMPKSDIDSAILFAARANSRRHRSRPPRYVAVAAGIACMGLVVLISHHRTSSPMPESLRSTSLTRVDSNAPMFLRSNPDVIPHPVSSAPLHFVLPEMPQTPAVRSEPTLAAALPSAPAIDPMATHPKREIHPQPRPETTAERTHQDNADSKAPTTTPTSAPRFAEVPSDLRLWQRAPARSSASGLNDLVLNAYPAGAEVHPASEVHRATPQTGIEAQHTAIDLNEPGALDRLARDNPDHYTKIRKILAEVDEIPERSVDRWMKTQFNATDITYSPYLLTSNPPKKELSFTLETTHYEALLTLTHDGARLFPVRP